jgi:hypothetical protein
MGDVKGARAHALCIFTGMLWSVFWQLCAFSQA